jgi:Amidohydrolase
MDPTQPRAAIELDDANALLGPVATERGAGDAVAMLAMMDRLRITSALVTHSHAWRHDVSPGNQMVLAAIAGQPRLRPCWMVLPDTCGEVPAPTDFLANAAASGVAAFRASPGDHGYDLLGPDLAKLLTGLEEYARPLFVDLDQVTWAQVDALAERHTGLPVVVTRTGYREVRPMAGVLDRRPNVHVDLSYLGTHQVLEWLVARFGPTRVLFGTGFPLRDPADAVTRLLWSDLDDEAAAAVGAGTLRGLLSGGTVRS